MWLERIQDNVLNKSEFYTGTGNCFFWQLIILKDKVNIHSVVNFQGLYEL